MSREETCVNAHYGFYPPELRTDSSIYILYESSLDVNINIFNKVYL